MGQFQPDQANTDVTPLHEIAYENSEKKDWTKLLKIQHNKKPSK
jgi:hypothetical protein